MLKFTQKHLFILTASALLLMCMALNLKAQDAPPGGPARRPAPTPTPTPQSTPSNRGRAVGGRVIDGLSQRSKVQFVEGIYGVIRWKKEYGLPSTDNGQTPNKALNCTAFRVEATVQKGAPGTFGKASSVGYWTLQNEPTEENGYYICRYSIPPISICARARDARARNSPTAPALEAQCRAAGAAGEITPTAGPTITASPNPVVVPNGQTSSTTTITWKAAPDYTYSEIYLSVDNGEWSTFATGGDGSKSTTIKLGSRYTFYMMVYEGQAGTPKVIATLTPTAKN
jgi:hypothetical protein